jgi:hypothetical protein
MYSPRPLRWTHALIVDEDSSAAAYAPPQIAATSATSATATQTI